jgi:hypothetical protein
MLFETAKALVARAQERATWIGDDHDDPYEHALLTRSVSVEMHVALKEILDHLRSALDYCAHELCHAVTGQIGSAKIYFPITARGFPAVDFPSRVGKLMPGLLSSRRDLVAVLASFQPFASPTNNWLPDLASLANRTKHINLTVNSVEAADMTFTRKPITGRLQYKLRRADGSKLVISGLALIDAPNGIEGPASRLIYLGLGPIEQDLIGFLRSSLSGVRLIIERLEQTL